jgi:hypothetical protein
MQRKKVVTLVKIIDETKEYSTKIPINKTEKWEINIGQRNSPSGGGCDHGL